MSFKVIPISIKDANAFVIRHHRHNSKVRAAKYCIAALKNNTIVGVLVASIPNSRLLNDRLTIEFVRVCTDGTKNAISFLVSKGRRIAQSMGYQKIITYTLQEEYGASMKASGFIIEYKQKRINNWNNAHGRQRETLLLFENKLKCRWSINLI